MVPEPDRQSPVLRIGTRGSALALAQSRLVAAKLADLTGARCELVTIRTTGDVDPAPLTAIGGTGVFVTAVRAALMAGRVDCVVHSFKDLPTAPEEGVDLAAVPLRANPADVLCAAHGHTLDSLPGGSRVGTGSPRRAAQLQRLRPDVVAVPIRGNVDTRLATVGRTIDGVILAHAGLERLGRLGAVTEIIAVDRMVPAPAQGALAVECRSGDSELLHTLARLDDVPSRQAALAERAVLAGVAAGCSAPVGALAVVDAGRLTLRSRVISADGRFVIERQTEGDAVDAEHVGLANAAELLAAGAADLLGPEQ